MKNDGVHHQIGERWNKMRVGRYISESKQTDLEILHGRVLSVTLFLVAINSKLGKLENGVDPKRIVECRTKDKGVCRNTKETRQHIQRNTMEDIVITIEEGHYQKKYPSKQHI